MNTSGYRFEVSYWLALVIGALAMTNSRTLMAIGLLLLGVLTIIASWRERRK